VCAQNSNLTNGQHDHSKLYKSDGGNEIASAVAISTGDMDTRFVLPNQITSGIPSGNRELRSGQTLQTEDRTRKLEVKSKDIPDNREGLGTTFHRSDGGSSQQTDSEILQLETGPRSRRDGLLPTEVAEKRSLFEPSFCSNPKANSKDSNRSHREKSYGDATLANPKLVCRPTDIINDRTNNGASKSKPLTASLRRVLEGGAPTALANSRMAIIRQSLESEGLSKEAVAILSSDARKNTTANKDSNWRTVTNWAQEKGVDPWEYSTTNGINFLAAMVA
jgi:hypothetical protein